MIVRMLNPAAAQLPAVRRLFLAALERNDRDRDYITDLIISKCQDPRVGIWIGLEDGEPKALFVVRLPIDPKIDDPVFDLAANFGSQSLADALLETALQFTLSMGYSKATAFNQSGHSDAAYIRWVRRAGLKARHKCSVIELDLNKEDPENGLRRRQLTER